MTVSVIVYGRNDDHGYNMHKRVAISLNSIAEKLSHSDDEIIFVDWNSPDHLPTLIEDIFDTLTPNTQSLLKVFRVRSKIHERISPSDSNRPTIEPFARNVGIRRSNPNNRWILNTNTDMVFLSGESSLSDVFAQLPKGFYNSYRFEIPEYLWNSSSRLNPKIFLSDLQKWKDSANLMRRVYLQREDHIVPDAPGDFQLAPRETLFELHGFPESMLYGWHVDSAMSQLLVELLGHPVILEEDQVQGFHCNHLRHLTHFHTSNEKQNDFVSGSHIKISENNWGLPDDDIEDINVLELNQKITNIIQNISPSGYQKPESSVDVVTNILYPTEITFTFLIDSLVTKPASTKVIYVGFNLELQEKLLRTAKLLALQFEAIDVSQIGNFSNLELDNTTLLIFDLGFDVSGAKEFSKNEINEKKKQLAILIENIPTLAKVFRNITPSIELAVLGPLSWGMRLMLGNDFQTPLFNNYSQILTGRVRTESQADTTKLAREMMKADIRNHFDLPQTNNPVSIIIRLALRYCPSWLKQSLKPIVYFVFKSVQKLR